MWNTFFVEAGAMRLAAHVDGPPLGSAVVVTGDAVLGPPWPRVSFHLTTRSVWD